MKEPINWKEYEQEIVGYFRSEYPAATITPNARLLGRFSKIERQIDLLIQEQASDFNFRVIVDAKHYNKRIDVGDVEQFLGLLRDVTQNRLSQVTKPDQTTLTFQYDSNSNITAVLDANSKVLESHTYDGNHRGLTSSRAGGVEALTITYQ